MSSIVLVTGDIRVNKIEQSLLSSPLESSGFPERTRKTNKQASKQGSNRMAGGNKYYEEKVIFEQSAK